MAVKGGGGERGGAVRPRGAPLPPIALAPLNLLRWDREGRGDLLAVHVWSDVRPLRGAAGLLDWRLCGRLSALMRAGRLIGAEGEQLLLPTGGRVPWRLAMVMGMGSRADLTVGRVRGAVARVITAVQGLGLHDLTIAPPGRDIDALPARRAMELVLAELRASPNHGLTRVAIVESAAAHKELADLAATG